MSAATADPRCLLDEPVGPDPAAIAGLPTPAEKVAFCLDFDEDQDFALDLAKVGIVLTTHEDDEAADAPWEPIAARVAALQPEQNLTLANQLLRRLAADEAERSALSTALKNEVVLIGERYQREIRKVEARASWKRFCLEALAALMFPSADAKKKSIALPYGTVGRKDFKPTVQLVDEPATAEYLRTANANALPQRPDNFVRVTVKLPLSQAREFLTESEILAAKREVLWSDLKKVLDGAHPESLPPGVQAVPASTKYFAEITEG